MTLFLGLLVAGLLLLCGFIVAVVIRAGARYEALFQDDHHVGVVDYHRGEIVGPFVTVPQAQRWVQQRHTDQGSHPTDFDIMDLKEPVLTPLTPEHALPEDPTPQAEWTLDCGGKQDYDGPLVSISTRYWPASKSSTGMCSASAAIILHHAEHVNGWRDYTTLIEQDFEAPTETEVKSQVERWVLGQYRTVLLRVQDLPDQQEEVS